MSDRKPPSYARASGTTPPLVIEVSVDELRRLDTLLSQAGKASVTQHDGARHLVAAHIQAREMLRTLFERPRRIAST
jgi:hypothetical protein